MNIKTYLLAIAFCATYTANAQIEQDTLKSMEADSAEAYPDIEEAPVMIDEEHYDNYDYAVAAPAEEAIPPAIYYNRFMYKNLSSSLVNNPDKPARYKSGIIAMNEEIQTYLRTPYMYGVGAKFVIIEVTVGVDSLLYNPKVVYSSGGSFDENAKSAIEQLSLRFIPAKKNGKDVPSTILIPIRFERKNEYGY
jgi:hypothetical protein